MNRTAYPNGHFYSPVVNPDEVQRDAQGIWPASPRVLGIDFNDDAHRHILDVQFPLYIKEFDYPEEGPPDSRLEHFYFKNSQFSWLDAPTLFVLLRMWRPKRIIEVGSGYSSLLMVDVNRRFLGSSAVLTCIESYPRDFLSRLDGTHIDLLQRRVQDVDPALFESLEAGDILFIDSSHVAKTGSDVNFLYFEILPRLAAGVHVHIHDIFLPQDYPRDWVIKENRSWNEQYVLRALLMDSKRYRVEFGSNYAFCRFPERVAAALRGFSGSPYGGGSFWITVQS